MLRKRLEAKNRSLRAPLLKHILDMAHWMEPRRSDSLLVTRNNTRKSTRSSIYGGSE